MKSDLSLDLEMYQAMEMLCYEELKAAEGMAVRQGKHIFSEEYNQKIQELLYGKPQTDGFLHNQSGGRMKLRYLFIAVILMVLASASVMAVEPVRERLGDIFYTVFTNNVEISEEEGEGTDVQNTAAMVVKRPAYIPEGYEVLEETMSEAIEDITIYWENEKGDLLMYTQYSIKDNVSSITSDGSKPEKVKVDGYDGVLIWDRAHGDNEGTLFFENESYIYMISGCLQKEELIQILESIE